MSTFQLPVVRAKTPAWNKGRIIGQKRPLQPKHVWAIRERLEIADNIRDLALFNMAIDCKLRGCNLERLKVRDVFVSGHIKERASVMQSKTQRPVQFEITEQAANLSGAGSKARRCSGVTIFGQVAFMTVRICRRGGMPESCEVG
jgi:hypothetical protein